MDTDNTGGSDSDSYVIVGSENYVSSDSETYVGSDSDNFVVVGGDNHVATDSEEYLFSESKEQLKDADNVSYVVSDSEEDLSDESGEQSKIVDNHSYVFDSFEKGQQSKIGDNESYLCVSDETGQHSKIVDTDSYVGTDSDESVHHLKNVDNDSYVGTDSEEYLSDESEQQAEVMDDEYHMDGILSGDHGKIVHCTRKFHRYPCKRIGRVPDFFELPGVKKLNEDMDINDVTMEHVLPFLPAKTLCRLRTVSKQWDQWIGSPFFIHKQTHSFKEISGLFCQLPGGNPFFISLDNGASGIPPFSLGFLPGPVTIITACNGLLCCQSWDREDTYYICNPVNKQWRKLPKSEYYHGPDSVLALAFEPSVLNFASHFELVCAFSVTGHSGVYFDIYSSRLDSWEVSETVCCELDVFQLNGNALLLKGVVLWETSTGVILAFDLKEKQYSMLPLPFFTVTQGVLTEMYGELCYILPREEDGQYTLEIYRDMVMNLKRKIYLVGEIFNNVTEQLRALAFLNDDTVLILLGSRLVAYHVKAGEAEILRSGNTGTNAGYARYLPYVNSLVQI